MAPRQLGIRISPHHCGGLFIAAGFEELIVPANLADPTAVIRDAWRTWGSPRTRVCYVARCKRDEPTAPDRLPEFTQIGVEVFDGSDAEPTLRQLLDELGVRYQLERAPRDASYYIADGFVVKSDQLAIAAGGPYDGGSGWAIGLERLLAVLDHGRSETAMT